MRYRRPGVAHLYCSYLKALYRDPFIRTYCDILWCVLSGDVGIIESFVCVCVCQSDLLRYAVGRRQSIQWLPGRFGPRSAGWPANSGHACHGWVMAPSGNTAQSTPRNFWVSKYGFLQIHDRSKVWGHPDNFVSSMKTHFYLSNELKIE